METSNQNIKTQVYNLVILDKSGSMESIRKEAVDGYNETLATIRLAQQKHMDTQEHYVTLAAFCGCGITKIYDKTPINAADKLQLSQYEPCCCTPLFDAIGISVKQLKHDIQSAEDAAVLVTIITDGFENASREWTSAAVKALIDECKKDGWMFSFIGASEDILKVASKLAIDNTLLWNKSHAGTEAMFDTVESAQERYYDKMAAPCCVGASVAERKKMRKAFAENYFED